MKKWWLVMILLLFLKEGEAQTFREWFRQKKTQIDYLVKQIVGLQIYIEQAREGYEIAEKGLNLIGNIKDGDFTLHRDFFAALSNVNPAISNSKQVADIIRWQLHILEVSKNNFPVVQSSEYLSEKEINYISGVYGRINKQALDHIKELLALTTPGEYVLSDDERLQRINRLHVTVGDQNTFIRSFADQTNVLIAQRKQENQEAIISSRMILNK